MKLPFSCDGQYVDECFAIFLPHFYGSGKSGDCGIQQETKEISLSVKHQWAHFCFWISNYSLESVTIVDILHENYSGHLPFPYHWSSSFAVSWCSSDPK